MFKGIVRLVPLFASLLCGLENLDLLLGMVRKSVSCILVGVSTIASVTERTTTDLEDQLCQSGPIVISLEILK
jgi:hypothetical protein